MQQSRALDLHYFDTCMVATFVQFWGFAASTSTILWCRRLSFIPWSNLTSSGSFYAWVSHLPGHGITPPEVLVLRLNPKDLKMKCVCVKYNLIVCGGGVFIVVVIIWKDERNGGMKIWARKIKILSPHGITLLLLFKSWGAGSVSITNLKFIIHCLVCTDVIASFL